MSDIDFDAMADRCYDAGYAAGKREAPPFPDDERRAMQRRIKNQRRELRRLNATCRGLDLLVRTYSNKMAEERRNGYRHAAQIAESIHYWPFGRRIGAYIRKWI